MSSTGDLITRKYSNFRGVDFRGDGDNLARSPDSLNVWRDYKETDSIRTRPGMKPHTSFTDTVYGIFFYKGSTLVHSGTKLYKIANGAKTEIYAGLNEAVSNSFVYEGIWYFMDGQHYLQYDGTTIKEVEGYIPITSISRKMVFDGDGAAGGTTYEDVNMLSDYRINTFYADTTGADDTVAKVFYLDTKNVDEHQMPTFEIDGIPNPKRIGDHGDNTYTAYDENEKALYHYSLYYDEGVIHFHGQIPAPLTDGRDNVKIKFKKTVSGYKENILNCTSLQVFDNRVFVSGNKDYPNTVWHCSLNDPTYFSDLDYYREGLDSAQIKGLVAGNNALWVFREPSEANTTVFYHTPTIDSEYGKIYPSQHSSVTTGCVGKAINFNDDIVFFSERGMEGISGDITTEQVVAHRSSLVDRKLITEAEYQNMILEEWEGYLLVFIGSKVYLADSRKAFTYENHIEYEWFYWSLEKAVTCAKVHNGVLYLGTNDGVYTLTDTNSDVESYWVTPKDQFRAPHKLKTSNKRGCVVEATGDIEVYAKVEDTDFELIGSYENVTDYFVSRIKRKKFKDIQLKFYSKTRFSLETASLECFIGGYIKR